MGRGKRRTGSDMGVGVTRKKPRGPGEGVKISSGVGVDGGGGLSREYQRPGR